MDVLNYLEPKFHPILISGLGDIAIFAYKRRILYLNYLWVRSTDNVVLYSTLYPRVPTGFTAPTPWCPVLNPLWDRPQT